MENQPEIKLTDRIRFHMLLAAAGGVMDAYSYVDRGGVFATGQTGNFVLAAIRLLLKDYRGMGLAFVPIAAFWAGIFLARHFYYIYNREQVRWMSGVLLLETAVLFLVGFIPHTLPHLFANTAVSFTAAVQFCSFRSFGKNAAYAPVFCTGNMRSCAEMYYEGFARDDRECRTRAYHYTGILSAFFIGAVAGGALSFWLGERAVWLASGLLLISWKAVTMEKKNQKTDLPTLS
ncbi:YoaK family protein [Lacrimispora sp.]|uniref:YoaK family protein n=1 Tax=Lacrimispora sp. TaxID=2719234 RepID=UPI003460D1AC